MTMKRMMLGGQQVRIDDETGEIAARLDAGSSGSATPVKRAPISAASSAAAGNVLVAAVAGKSIQVLGIKLIAAADVVATFYTDAADTGAALSGPETLKEGSGFVCNPPAAFAAAWLATDTGESLTLLLSAAVQVSGFMTYIEADG